MHGKMIARPLTVPGILGATAGGRLAPGRPSSSFDTALTRQFRIRESQRLEIRTEAFNLTNILGANNPGVTLSAPNSFGLILRAQDPRIMQLATKFVF